jgi:hypothetical protein
MLFWQQKRRVSFEFEGYYPPSMQSYIPLKLYISPDYRRCTAKEIMERMPKASREVIDLLKTFGRKMHEW